MSGHSHAKTILHKKQITDAKRGQIFSKLSRQISVAAREKGDNPETNPALRIVIEKARGFNLPKENIERAIKRGSGGPEDTKLESVLFEAYGPGGIAIIIEGITDNKNRTLGEMKKVLSQNNGKLAGSGSVKWMFERKGCLEIQSGEEGDGHKEKKKEDLELLVIEAGAEDIYWHNNILDIYTKPEELEKVKKSLEEKGVQVESTTLDWVAKEQIELDEKNKEACQKLFEALDENDAIQEIYSNIKLP
jgi:YebC/PmpR family DNA-binding regulatory protein